MQYVLIALLGRMTGDHCEMRGSVPVGDQRGDTCGGGCAKTMQNVWESVPFEREPVTADGIQLLFR